MLLGRNKNKGKLTLQDLFSNEIMQASLEKLPFEHAENEGFAWEFFKLKNLESESFVLAMILRSLNQKLKLGDYTYRKVSDRIERESPLIKKQRKENLLFRLSKPFKVLYDPDKKEPQGLVTKIE